MEFKTHNDCDIETVGTSLMGYIDASYAELVEVLGEPTEGDDYKVDANWHILNMDTGESATIYNYKDGKNYNGRNGTPKTEIRDWHIGGRSSEAVKLVKSLFPDHRTHTGW